VGEKQGEGESGMHLEEGHPLLEHVGAAWLGR